MRRFSRSTQVQAHSGVPHHQTAAADLERARTDSAARGSLIERHGRILSYSIDLGFQVAADGSIEVAQIPHADLVTRACHRQPAAVGTERGDDRLLAATDVEGCKVTAGVQTPEPHRAIAAARGEYVRIIRLELKPPHRGRMTFHSVGIRF